MKSTKKKICSRKKSLKKKKYNQYEKILIDSYNSAMFEKVPLILKSDKLTKEEIERFCFVYCIYRSGCYNYFDKNQNIIFTNKWFPESEDISLEKAVKAKDSLNWDKFDRNTKYFYEMKELNSFYSKQEYKKIFSNLKEIIKKK
jgi:hypothetical protein